MMFSNHLDQVRLHLFFCPTLPIEMHPPQTFPHILMHRIDHETTIEQPYLIQKPLLRIKKPLQLVFILTLQN